MQGIRGPLIFDTSVLFNLGHRGGLESLLDRLSLEYELIVPEEVLEEASEQQKNRQYYQHLVKDKFRVRAGAVPGEYEDKIEALSSSLGSGELAVIVLALETEGTAVIDDPTARVAARSLGLKIIGTIGILMVAVRKRWITDTEALSIVQRLRSAGFRIPAVQSGQSFEAYVKSLEESQY